MRQRVAAQRNSPPSVNVKIRFEDEIRIFSCAATFEALADEVRHLFSSCRKKDFDFQYVDQDCDTITVSSTKEISQAIDSELVAAGANALWLTIVLREAGRACSGDGSTTADMGLYDFDTGNFDAGEMGLYDFDSWDNTEAGAAGSGDEHAWTAGEGGGTRL